MAKLRKALLTHGRTKRGKVPFTMDRGGSSFHACVVLKSGRRGTKMPSYYCAKGKNPRTALGAAMKKAGAALAKRPGAFAGFGS